MKRIAVRFCVTLLALAGGAGLVAGGSAAAGAQNRPRADRHVVLLCIDGFGAYNVDDPRMSLPNIRALAARGSRAEAMTVSTPSVTWPNHTTMVTGVTPAKHGVLANGRIEPATATPLAINPRRSKEELCRATTVYDIAHRAGLKTAEINWPVTRSAPTLHFSFPDHPEPLNYTTPSLVQDLLKLGWLTGSDNASFSQLGPVGRDQVWTQAAIHLLKKERPNLLMLHLLNTDGQQHAHGPQTAEAATAISLADRYVGDVLQALQQTRLAQRTSVFIVADHGFIRVTKQIKPNARLRSAGLIRSADGGKLQYDVQSISEGGVALVYVPQARTRPELVTKAKAALDGLEGLETILTPEQYGRYGLPTPDRNPESPHLVLAAKDGYAFSNDPNGDEIVTLPRAVGTHGYLQTNPKVDGAFVAAGAGIRKGVRLPRVANLDVAPTIAHLLGLRMEGVDGRVLDEILTEKK
jgi:predicted AlkP superfamily pyrophosphatase or phosphodiesterase